MLKLRLIQEIRYEKEAPAEVGASSFSPDRSGGRSSTILPAFPSFPPSVRGNNTCRSCEAPTRPSGLHVSSNLYPAARIQSRYQFRYIFAVNDPGVGCRPTPAFVTVAVAAPTGATKSAIVLLGPAMCTHSVLSVFVAIIGPAVCFPRRRAFARIPTEFLRLRSLTVQVLAAVPI